MVHVAWRICGPVSAHLTGKTWSCMHSEQSEMAPAGTSLPKGKAAVGWRVAVYWRDDKAFYPAEIMGYDTATGRHEVEYDDGEPS